MTHIIEIDGNRYEARIIDMKREVKVNGQWMGTDELVNHLIENGELEQLNSLVMFGIKKIKDNPDTYGKMLIEILEK